jgi:hypothetical protein
MNSELPGNVLTTVNDQKLFVHDLSVFEAVIETSQDYYPFGMLMPGRKYNPAEYRFGFQGWQKTDEIAGSGNHYTAEFIEYDPRTVQRWNPDPEWKQIPQWSPYVVLGDNPIGNIDKKGDIWDVIADIVFIAYDIGEITYDYVTKGKVEPVSIAALSADVTAAVVPFVTGAGLAVRAGTKTAQAVEKASSIISKTIKFAGFGGDIAVKAEKTTTVLGRFPGAIEKLKESGAFAEKGLNFLNLGKAEYSWEKNVEFLDKAIERSDVIRFVSNPTEVKNLYEVTKTGQKKLTTFGKEVEYLKSKGYEIKGSEAVKKVVEKIK